MQHCQPCRMTCQSSGLSLTHVRAADRQAAASEAGAEHAETTLWCHVLLLHALLPPPPAAPDDIAAHQTLVQGPPPRGAHSTSVRGNA